MRLEEDGVQSTGGETGWISHGKGCFYSREKEKEIGAHAGFDFLCEVGGQRRLDF